MKDLGRWIKQLCAKWTSHQRESRSYRTARYETLERRVLLSADPMGLGDITVEQALLPFQAELAVPLVPGDGKVGPLMVEATDQAPIKAPLTEPATDLASVPHYVSDANAEHTLFLDFDGHSQEEWGSFTDINVSPFKGSTADMLWICDVVADDYAPFDVNVTTVEPLPSAFDNGAGWRAVIGGNGSSHGFGTNTLGVAYINEFLYGSDPNVVFVFSDNFDEMTEIGNTISHEIGHTVGLRHYWHDDDDDGRLDYGENTNPGAIMATPDQGLNRETWSFGAAADNTELTKDQHDVEILADRLGRRNDNSGSNSRSTAPVLSLSSDGQFSFHGVLEQRNDIDYLALDIPGNGPATFTIDIDPLAHNLDVVLSLYDSLDGPPLQQSASSTSYGALIEADLQPGRYYLGISSDGEHGEIGRYQLSGQVPTDAPPQVSHLTLVEDTGQSDSDRITRDTTPVLTVHFSEAVWGQNQDIQLHDPIGNVVALGPVSGWGSSTLTFDTAEPLSRDGTYQVVLGQGIHDQSGQALIRDTQAPLTFVLDTQAPTVTTNPLQTSNPTPGLSGTIDDPQAKILITLNGRNYDAINQGDGTWTLPDNTVYPGLNLGSYTVRARATDLAGNSSVSDLLDGLTIQSSWGGLFGSFWGSPPSSSYTLPMTSFTTNPFTLSLPSLNNSQKMPWQL